MKSSFKSHFTSNLKEEYLPTVFYVPLAIRSGPDVTFSSAIFNAGISIMTKP